MTVVAAAGVDDIAAESDKCAVLSLKVEGNRRDFKPPLDYAF